MAETLVNTGFHSEVSLVEHQGKSFVRKSYGHKAGGFAPEQARALAMHMQTFVDAAQEIGIPVTRPASRIIEPNGHPGAVTLVEMVPYVGVDLRQRFSNPALSNDEVIGDIEQYLQMHNQAWDTGFRISLDPPPANFCRDEDGGRVWYIDTMPPRHKVNGQIRVSEWPEPPEEHRSFIADRYFSPRQSQVIYPQIMRALGFRTIDPSIIKDLMRHHLGPDVSVFIDFPIGEKRRILENPHPYEADALRIIAVEDLVDHPDPKTLERVFALTHIQAGGVLPTMESVSDASRIIKEHHQASGVIYDATHLN